MHRNSFLSYHMPLSASSLNHNGMFLSKKGFRTLKLQCCISNTLKLQNFYSNYAAFPCIPTISHPPAQGRHSQISPTYLQISPTYPQTAPHLWQILPAPSLPWNVLPVVLFSTSYVTMWLIKWDYRCVAKGHWGTERKKGTSRRYYKIIQAFRISFKTLWF